MNIKTSVCSLIAVLFLISCDDNTAGLGGSITPESEILSVISDSCFATSGTILSPDSLLVMTQQYNLGRFTEQTSGATFESGIISQLNCPENYLLPDSAYGVGDFKFPDWFKEKVGSEKPYYANLRLYYTSFFGDSTNTIRLEVFPLDRMIDVNRKYYPSIDPSQFCDLSKEPIATITASAYNYQTSDSLLSLENRISDIVIPLPDSIAENILETYYSADGRQYFADANAFMEHFCKGFYIRCTQGDGTVLYISSIVLQVNLKTIDYSDGEPEYMSILAEFYGNSEVLQMNCIRWSGLEGQLSDNTGTWIRSPFGVLTEITLPVDEIKDENTRLNSAQMYLSSANTPSDRFKPSTPATLALIRKGKVQDFFSRYNSVDNRESFISTYSSKLGTYSYDNLAPLIEEIYADRNEWLQENGMTADESGKQAYAEAHPDWNKAVLIPVVGKSSSINTGTSYQLDMRMHQVKLIGGADSKIKIKVIKSEF